MKKIGNLFELAKLQLIREGEDIQNNLCLLDRAIAIRKWLDRNPSRVKEAMKLSKEEIKRNNRACRKRYYLKYGK